MNFIKLPNDIIYNFKTKDNTLLQLSQNEYTIPLLLYINFGYNKLTESYVFCIKEFISFLNEKPNQHTNIPYIKNAIDILKSERYITDLNLTNFKLNDFISCNLSDKFEKDKNNLDKNFFTVNYSNFLKLKNIKSKYKKKNIITVYLYILSRCFKKHGSTVVSGGVAKVFWGELNQIADSLSISTFTLKNCLGVLSDNGLVWFGNVGSVKRGDDIRNSITTFTVFGEDELLEGLKQSKLYYKGNGFTTTNSINNLNSVKGKKGAIYKKINNGTATNADLKELKEINNTLKTNKEKITILKSSAKVISINSKYNINLQDKNIEIKIVK